LKVTTFPRWFVCGHRFCHFTRRLPLKEYGEFFKISWKNIICCCWTLLLPYLRSGRHIKTGGGRKKVLQSSMERLRLGSNYSSYETRWYNSLRTLSPDRSHMQHWRSLCFDRSRWPTRSPTPSFDARAIQIERDQRLVKCKYLPKSSSLEERRKRCYKSRIRESIRLKRQRGGKKPFYITLNVEGISYGPSKPTWTAKVNKLAAWLDPSCTHICKQTYEDMTILKDRLNDNFKYSRNFNQDHMRGLFSKALTKKMTELIVYIKKGGKQPLNWHQDLEMTWKAC